VEVLDTTMYLLAVTIFKQYYLLY